MLLSIMPFPVLRSMMSKIISKSEQGEWGLGLSHFCVCVYTVMLECVADLP